MAILAGMLIGVKDPGKVRNWRVPNSRIVLLILDFIHIIPVKTFIPGQLIHGCRYSFINNTNKFHLILSMCFWV